MIQAGLYVVSVPIGNIQDITLRALETLKQADIILCEDTRNTKKLLSLHQIASPLLIRCDAHTEKEYVQKIISWVKQEDKIVVLVSDAGTPLISDPGYVLLSSLRQEDIYITSIPGVSSVTTALSLSGLPCQEFAFLGFLPKKQQARIEKIKKYMVHNMTYIFFERAERVEALLNLFIQLDLSLEITIMRELTKKFEESIYGTAQHIITLIQNKPLKGEIVIAAYLNIVEKCVMNPEEKSDHVKALLDKGMHVKDIVHQEYQYLCMSKKECYDYVQEIKNTLEK